MDSSPIYDEFGPETISFQEALDILRKEYGAENSRVYESSGGRLISTYCDQGWRVQWAE